MLEAVASYRYVVNREGLRFEDTGRQWTILEAGESISSHVELNELSFEVSKAIQLFADHLFDLLTDILAWASLDHIAFFVLKCKHILSEDSRVD